MHLTCIQKVNLLAAILRMICGGGWVEGRDRGKETS